MWNIVKPRRSWCLSTPLQRRFGPQSLAALLPCQAIGGHRARLDFQAVQKHPSTSVFVNFASFRSVHETTLEAGLFIFIFRIRITYIICWVAPPQSHGIPPCGVGGGVGSMYIYVYIVYIYVYVYVYVSVSVYVCICLYMSVYVCICMYMYVYVCICMYMYVYVCTCLYMSVYVCICMYMYVYVYVYVSVVTT